MSDVVFILGAGASPMSGAPLMGDSFHLRTCSALLGYRILFRLTEADGSQAMRRTEMHVQTVTDDMVSMAIPCRKTGVRRGPEVARQLYPSTTVTLKSARTSMQLQRTEIYAQRDKIKTARHGPTFAQTPDTGLMC